MYNYFKGYYKLLRNVNTSRALVVFAQSLEAVRGPDPRETHPRIADTQISNRDKRVCAPLQYTTKHHRTSFCHIYARLRIQKIWFTRTYFSSDLFPS